MKKTILALIAGLLVGAFITFSLVRPSPESREEKHEEENKSIVEHGTNGEVVLKLEKERQEHIGLQTAPLQAAQIRPEIKAYGQVLDPTPYATLLIEKLSTEAALQVSSNEYQRLKTLYGQEQNVSTRAFEAAEAAMKRDSLLLAAAKTKLTLALGESVGSQSNLETFVQSLVSLKHALVRIDIPINETLPAAPEAARIAIPGADEHPVTARFLGVAPLASPQTQGQSFLFLIETNPPPPGTAVAAWLQIHGAAQEGVLVPRAAVLRHEGKIFIYSQTGADTFERKEIELGRPFENGYFVHEGVSTNDRVVIAGAQQLLSAELNVFEGEE
jgi:membrane fusion protein, multidrug efflux system